MVGVDQADEYIRSKTIPVMLDAYGKPMKRNFVHISDLVGAILKAVDHPKAYQQTFNICMDEPVDYGKVGAYLVKTRGCNTVSIPSEFHSTWLDNTKAKFLLDWRPEYDLERLIEAAFNYQRAGDDPRIV